MAMRVRHTLTHKVAALCPSRLRIAWHHQIAVEGTTFDAGRACGAARPSVLAVAPWPNAAAAGSQPSPLAGACVSQSTAASTQSKADISSSVAEYRCSSDTVSDSAAAGCERSLQEDANKRLQVASQGRRPWPCCGVHATCTMQHMPCDCSRLQPPWSRCLSIPVQYAVPCCSAPVGTRARRGTQAMVDVAQSYERGLGVGCDVLQAKFWYEKSAQHGSADGAYTVCSRRL